MARLRGPLLMQVTAAVVFFGLWEAASRLRWVDAELLPPFSTVLVALGGLLQSSDFLGHSRDTLVRVAVAFVISAPLAVAVGFILGEKRRLGEVFSPLLHFAMAVPQSIFLPIFMLIFGIGFLQKIVFGITHTFFVVVVNTVAAVRSVPKPLVLAARSFGASRSQIYRQIYLPAMLPLIVTGLRLGMIFNIVGILLAEMYASQTGLGVLIFRWGESNDMVRLMAATLFTSVATIVINELMRVWEARAGRWQRSLAGA